MLLKPMHLQHERFCFNFMFFMFLLVSQEVATETNENAYVLRRVMSRAFVLIFFNIIFPFGRASCTAEGVWCVRWAAGMRGAIFWMYGWTFFLWTDESKSGGSSFFDSFCCLLLFLLLFVLSLVLFVACFCLFFSLSFVFQFLFRRVMETKQ